MAIFPTFILLSHPISYALRSGLAQIRQQDGERMATSNPTPVSDLLDELHTNEAYEGRDWVVHAGQVAAEAPALAK